MAQLKFSDRMDPRKQLERDIPEEARDQNWERWWPLKDEVVRLFNAGRPYPAAVSEAKTKVGWQ